ncbi:MAG: SBBP repeat-containing protein, partial [Planctomycetota bacterium]
NRGEGQWITFIGGTTLDRGRGIAVDANGNTYLGGVTRSTDLPAARNEYPGGSESGFITRLRPNGNIHWSIYLGGSGKDTVRQIDTDADGYCFASGTTSSADFIAARYQLSGDADAFVSMIEPNGLVRWTTFVGGSRSEEGWGLNVHPSGDFCVVSGSTVSEDMPLAVNTYAQGGGDAFATVVSRSGRIRRSTYVGGSSRDFSYGVAVDADGDIFVSGTTMSPDLPSAINRSHGGKTDAFITRLFFSDGTVDWTRYLGGSGFERGYGVVIDPFGNAVVSGQSDSSDFEGQSNVNHGGLDAYIARVSADGDLMDQVFLGGSDFEYGYDLTLLGSSIVYLSGYTGSIDFAGAGNTFRGNQDGYISRVELPERPFISVSGVCEASTHIEVVNVAPFARVAIVFGLREGNREVPDAQPCAGTILNIEEIVRTIPLTANSDGVAVYTRPLSQKYCGRYIQAINLENCLTSNVLMTPN